MKMEIKCSIVYHFDAIEKVLGKSKEEFKEWIDENVYEELEDLLSYEFEGETLVTVENLEVKY